MPSSPLRAAVLAGLCLLSGLAAAAPAGAVVGGDLLDEARVPWLANLGCGGSLVAPDRVLTAAHCVGNTPLSAVSVTVAGQARAVAGVSLPRGWRHANGPQNYRDDIALVMLAERVEGVPIAAIGGAPDPAMRILGRGFQYAPGGGHSESDNWHAILRQTTLRTMTDRACAKAFRHDRGNGGERFDGSRMICAIDPDGRAPLSSGCNGDSGGPLMAGSYESPRILGVVSFGGTGCGADHLPSVFTEVERYRSFILAAHPVLAPATSGVATLRRTGRTLTCAAPAFTNAPTRVAYLWSRAKRGVSRVVGRHRRHRLGGAADGGAVFTCTAEGSNAGGHALAVSQGFRVPR